MRLTPAGVDGAGAPGAAVTARRSGPRGPRTVHVVRPVPGPGASVAESRAAGTPNARATAGSAAVQRTADVEDAVVEVAVVEVVVVVDGAVLGGAGFGGTGFGGTGSDRAGFPGAGVLGDAGVEVVVEVADVEVAEVGATAPCAAGAVAGMDPDGVADVDVDEVGDDPGGACGAGPGAATILGPSGSVLPAPPGAGGGATGDPVAVVGTPPAVDTLPAVGIRLEGVGRAASVGVPSTIPPAARPPSPASSSPVPVESGTGSAPEA